MSINRIYQELEGLAVGRTTTINHKVVTRWSSEKYEVGTFGKNTVSFETAAEEVAS